LIGGFVHDKRWFVVRNVAKILGDIGNERCVSFLKKSAVHSDQRVRMESLRALQRIPGSEAQQMIAGFLKDSKREIRIRALRAVRPAGSQAVVPLLAGKIDRTSVTGLDQDELRELFNAYARAAGAAALKRLTRLADRAPWFGRKRWLPVRLAAVQAMAFCPAHETEAVLAALCRSRNRHITQAARETSRRRQEASYESGHQTETCNKGNHCDSIDAYRSDSSAG
jgi:hypothetical protein